MSVVQLNQMGNGVEVLDRGRDEGRYPSVHVHGCDTTLPGSGKIAVHGVQNTWTDEHGRLHISDDKRAGPNGSRGGLGGLGGL